VQRKLGAMITAAVSVLCGSFVSANAASLPAPAKLCALIANGIMSRNVAKWQRSDQEYFCASQDMIFPTGPDTEGVVYMTHYEAAGLTKNRASRFYFKIQTFDSMLRKDQIAAPILSRIKAIFAASNAGAVPGDLVKAVDDVATTSVSTALGVVRTRFTPGSDASMPYNSATFEVQLDVSLVRMPAPQKYARYDAALAQRPSTKCTLASVASGQDAITICDKELGDIATKWAATNDPIVKGRYQLDMGYDYYAKALYCVRSTNSQCARGTDRDLAVSSIKAATDSFEHAMRDSGSDPTIVSAANKGLGFAKRFANTNHVGAVGTDASAIASFLSIGFANAPTHFSAIRGGQVDSAEYAATKWPNRTHFVSCHTWHFKANADTQTTELYMYSCNSTLRADPREALFKMAEHAVRANLPSGYTSSGEQARADGVPWEVWKRSGSPDVKLWSFASHGKPYYELSVEVNP